MTNRELQNLTKEEQQALEGEKKKEPAQRHFCNSRWMQVTHPPELEPLHIPDGATDVSSTFLRLHTKKYAHAEDEGFHIVEVFCLSFVVT